MGVTIDDEGNYHFPLTQGQRKVLGRIRLLFSNEYFLEELESVLRIPSHRKREKKLWKFAQDYRLDYEMGCPLIEYILNKKLPSNLEKDINLDVCRIRDLVDEYLSECFPREFNGIISHLPDKRLELNNFPIHISISPWASKRDVLDFINKRWAYIRACLDDHDEAIPAEKRKKKEERDSLIWENRSKPAREIAELINSKFPEENLTYSDIHSILYYLRQRTF